MPFVSRSNGHGRIPGIHKPALPGVPTVTNTATGNTTLTFSIGNYNAGWKYETSLSPSAGTTTRNGATVEITGLNSSTQYTLTVTVSGSGGIRSASGSATTATPPPFFPYFPYFPFFPGFPPPPSFPPRFPPPSFPPRFPPPSFPPRFPPSKTTPSNYQRDAYTITILTKDYGHLDVKYLTEDDELVSFNIEDFDEGSYYVKINNIHTESSMHNLYMINNEVYPENCYLLVEKNNNQEFINCREIDKSYKIYNIDSKNFIDISEISVEEYSGNTYNIECIPNNFYIIQSSLGYLS